MPFGNVLANFAELPFPEGGCAKCREDLTARLVDVSPARSEGSLAVTQGSVVAVYGLDLVEAGPAI
jgi:hypothetical protein